MRYERAPILEAVLAFSWDAEVELGSLEEVLTSTPFSSFEAPTPRIRHGARIDVAASEFEHEQTQLGFQAEKRDGSEIVFLEKTQFVFVKPAPYDRWETFSSQATSLLEAVVNALHIDHFNRVGLRFVNRIDVPDPEDKGINTDDYVTVKFNGPRQDVGVIEEFQMRVVKPTACEGISYALVLATTAPPMPGFQSILLDIDVFHKPTIASKGRAFSELLGKMRTEKNEIFQECLTDKARALFGRVEE